MKTTNEHGFPKVNLYCPDCGKTARRPLVNAVACRGVHETPAEIALCPSGHGRMLREDGFNEDWVWGKR